MDPPEQLLSALLLQVFYGIRSERQLMEQLDYNLLYRWFVGLSPDDPVWDPTTFTKNRDRLQNGEVFAKFMTKLLNHPQVKPLLSDEPFSVDGTLIQAWASQKSFRPKDGSGDGDGATSTGRSARMTRMRVRPTPTAVFTTRPRGGRRNSPIWATPPWRTGIDQLRWLVRILAVRPHFPQTTADNEGRPSLSLNGITGWRARRHRGGYDLSTGRGGHCRTALHVRRSRRWREDRPNGPYAGWTSNRNPSIGRESAH